MHSIQSQRTAHLSKDCEGMTHNDIHRRAGIPKHKTERKDKINK